MGYQVGSKNKGHKIDFIDVRRPYFHAKVRCLVYVNLPEEEAEPGMCGRLCKAFYGTRDAAQNWEHSYTEFLWSIGFVSSTATPCIFHHTARDLRVVVHSQLRASTGFAARSQHGSKSSSVVGSAQMSETTSQSAF